METVLDTARPLVHCPYCKDGFTQPRDAIACASCGARHHLECFRELDRCASCGGYEALARREIRCPRTHSKMNDVLTLVVIATFSFTSALVTYNWTVDRNADAPSRVHQREMGALEAKHEGIRSDLEKLALERHELARQKERLAAEHHEWFSERDRHRKVVAEELELSRQLAREGWRVAELIARSPPGAEGTLRRLREAKRSLPTIEGAPSILEQALAERIAEEERLR